MISFVKAQGSVKIKLACSKDLLLTISFSINIFVSIFIKKIATQMLQTNIQKGFMRQTQDKTLKSKN